MACCQRYCAFSHQVLYLRRLCSPVVDFYNQINLLYGSITEFCSPQSCPEMKATDEYDHGKTLPWFRLTYVRFEYLWQDSENFKRPTKMTAPEYVEHLMSWVQSNIDNEQLFPSRIGTFDSAPNPLTLFLTFCRTCVSKSVPRRGSPDLQASLPSLRPYILPSLPCHRSARTRTTSQHQFQALCSFCGRALPIKWQGLLRTVGGSGGEHGEMRLIETGRM